MQGTQVPSLVGEIRSHVLRSAAKTRNKGLPCNSQILPTLPQPVDRQVVFAALTGVIERLSCLLPVRRVASPVFVTVKLGVFFW